MPFHARLGAIAGGVDRSEVGSVGQSEDGDLVIAQCLADALPVVGGVVGGQAGGVAGGADLAGFFNESAFAGEQREEIVSWCDVVAVNRCGADHSARLHCNEVVVLVHGFWPVHGLAAEEAIGIATRATGVTEDGAVLFALGRDLDKAHADIAK